MEAPKRHAANCKWAHATLEEPSPLWLAAEGSPWTCERDGKPQALETTEVCQDCPHWEGRNLRPSPVRG